MSISTGKFGRLTAGKSKVSASEWNRLVSAVEKLSKSGKGGPGMMGGSGTTPLQLRAQRVLGRGLYKVLDSVHGGDGVYYIYPVIPDASAWTDSAGADKLVDDEPYTTWATTTAYTALSDYVINDALVYRCMVSHTSGDADDEPGTGAVWETYWKVAYASCLNLMETYPLGTYSPALAAGDILMAFREWSDDVTTYDHPLWVGVPFYGSQARLAKATEAAGAVANITCNLLDVDGAEITSGLGSAIEVYGNICPAAVTALNACTPRIVDNDEFPVINIQGKWWFDFQFQGTTDCDCIDAQSTSYSVTNKTLDRSFDCNGGDINVVSDVLGSLIEDLVASGVIT